MQVDWKLTRGKFRPRLLDYAKEHSDAVVQSASTEAFRLAKSSNGDDGKSAIAELAKLKARSIPGSRLKHGLACHARLTVDFRQGYTFKCCARLTSDWQQHARLLHRASDQPQRPRWWPPTALSCHS